ncbi:MAG: hypothetical protein IJ265_04915 [Oscillospiraceae bacterium]|nr:hypothetical protein [Oscillospiraceae bacterium]
MKKYGQAELMYALMQVFLENEEHLTEQQKAEVAKKTAEDVFSEFPSARDMEVAA